MALWGDALLKRDGKVAYRLSFDGEYILRIFSQRTGRLPVDNIYYGILVRTLPRNNLNKQFPRGNICNYGYATCNYRSRLFPFLIERDGCMGFHSRFVAFRSY